MVSWVRGKQSGILHHGCLVLNTLTIIYNASYKFKITIKQKKKGSYPRLILDECRVKTPLPLSKVLLLFIQISLYISLKLLFLSLLLYKSFVVTVSHTVMSLIIMIGH